MRTVDGIAEIAALASLLVPPGLAVWATRTPARPEATRRYAAGVMAKVRSWAGLDVHAAKVVACVVDAESDEMTVHQLSGETAEVVAFCSGVPRPMRAAYEAGSTGYGLARALAVAETGCVVAAPGEIERPAQDKTDARDAERLVRLLTINALHAVRVPTPEQEALGDLETGAVEYCRMRFLHLAFRPGRAVSRRSRLGRGAVGGAMVIAIVCLAHCRRCF